MYITIHNHIHNNTRSYNYELRFPIRTRLFLSLATFGLIVLVGVIALSRDCIITRDDAL